MRWWGRATFLITTVLLCSVILALIVRDGARNAEYKRLAIYQQEARRLQALDLQTELARSLSLIESLNRSTMNVEKIFAIDDERSASPDNAPSLEHELLTRKIFNGIVELSYALEQEIYALEGRSSRASAISRLRSQQRSVLLDVEDLAGQFGTWRDKEWRSLQDIVRSRIEHVQNPQECARARKLTCEFKQKCGFGCQLHYLSYCFMLAYGLGRTLLVDHHGPWTYEPRGWAYVFRPPSDNCTASNTNSRQWKGDYDASEVETIHVNPMVFKKVPHFVPIAIPEDLAPRLRRLHGAPFVWWMGQFVRHLTRPQPWLQKHFDTTEKYFGFQSPVVGIHVRRTDKQSEAAFHGVEEYMKHVVEWFDKYDMRLSRDKNAAKAVRRVYIATDEPSVLPEAKKKYPDYSFISDANISRSAGLGTRYSSNSLRGLLVDIHFLSRCDYVVCTFSSQICRLVYELMQTRHPDASSFAHSLDDVYFVTGQTRGLPHIATYRHDARPGSDEIDLLVGDRVHYAGNHWNGYSKGKNARTGKTGLFPSYKVEPQLLLEKYPTHSRAKDGSHGI